MRPTPSAHSRIIAARRWPSRSRPSCNCVSACWAACRQAAPQTWGSSASLPRWPGQLNSSTRRGEAMSGRIRRAACSCSDSVSSQAGSSRDMSALALRVKDTRISTLPRASCAVSSSRSGVSTWRSSSGRRKYRSRKRLLTLRSSSASVPCSRSALALPKAVMLRIMVCLSCSLPEGWRVAAACTGRSRARERQYRGRILHAAAFCGVTGQGAGFRPDASPYNAAI